MSEDELWQTSDEDGMESEPPEQAGSVTRLIPALRAGDERARRRLYDLWMPILTVAAEKQLKKSPNHRGEGEDAANDALKSLYSGIVNDRFPRLKNSRNLWALVFTIMRRKALQIARKDDRRGKKMVLESTLRSGDEGPMTLDTFASKPTSPEMAPDQLMYRMAEELMERLGRRPEQHEVTVAVMKMAGYTDSDIADILKCTTRQVKRMVEDIRRQWERLKHD